MERIAGVLGVSREQHGIDPNRSRNLALRRRTSYLHLTTVFEILGDDLAWCTDEAVCSSVGGDLWFAEPGEDYKVKQARELCLRCPLVDPCRAYAIPRKNLHGVWGATSPAEREALRRAA